MQFTRTQLEMAQTTAETTGGLYSQELHGVQVRRTRHNSHL